ncbi:type IV pilus modification protein PilV [Janthinobacterium sp. PC23-8]|uniref:type IV pilus modification protein PilV n=1 Tax=Janthinobacterium sp. PC23-8 TaxID=2012679 RepID=UPI000B975324|nr:type IV pilus modification protein PilV [Janthinobacterium sp. PC23-8]OYO25714.1 type IV pilus modification protein PilV [Janthinobacterium sp. PC23-8]
MRHPVHAQGSTLIEVLVALLLLAVGLLGGSAMQLSSLRARHESALLSAATQLAASMAERMRANSAQLQLPDADNPYLGLDYEAGPVEESGGAPDCLGDTACGAAQLAQFDIAEWKQQLRKDLPAARLRICRDVAAWDAAAQGLQWSCSGGNGAPVVIKLGWRGRQARDRAAQEAAAMPKIAMQLAAGAP